MRFLQKICRIVYIGENDKGEGYEQEFLKGAEQTIKKHKPALLFSIYHSASDFFHIKCILESWNLGYTFKINRPPGVQVLLETMIIVEVK